MQIQRDAIMDGCAMACVLFTEKEIDKMLIGERAIEKPVLRVIAQLVNRDVIPTEEPDLIVIERDLKEKDTKIAEIMKLLKTQDLNVNEIAVLIGKDVKSTSYLVEMLRKKKRAITVKTGVKLVNWHLIDDTPFTLVRVTQNRKIAKANGDLKYHGALHACGETLRLTSSGECCKCKNAKDRLRALIESRKSA